MIKNSSLKIFLSNGITLTVNANEKITFDGIGGRTFEELEKYIAECIATNTIVNFMAEIDHTYKDEKNKEKHQNIIHKYFIPSEKITWFMIEEV